MLPGSREIGAFCAASGRAVLIRHWPDYRRSIELVVPGQAPNNCCSAKRPCWGSLATDAANASGRFWARKETGDSELVLINDAGTVLNRRQLAPWLMKAGTAIEDLSASNC